MNFSEAGVPRGPAVGKLRLREANRHRKIPKKTREKEILGCSPLGEPASYSVRDYS
jgi:hypothetical protein